jgi:hypothetical protein
MTKESGDNPSYTIERSLKACTLSDQGNKYESDGKEEEVPLPALYGFRKHILAPLLCRHPEPYAGGDDDPTKLREIANDVLVRMGHYEGDRGSKILFGPDHKIGKNLMTMIKQEKKYESFLPEFPCLHLRKSRITIIFSALKNTGLMQLLQYMRDHDSNEWAKLTTAQHIDTATRNVNRLARPSSAYGVYSEICHRSATRSSI